jgi:Bor protein.
MKKLNVQKVRKTILGFSCMTTILLLSSCYSTTVSVGDMKTTDPAVEVATVHNAHFVDGLVNSVKREAKDYVGENKSYRVKQYQSFVDGLLAGVTLGIYTPTTTKYYLPYGVAAPKIKAKGNGIPVTFGVRGGLNLSTMSFEHDATGIKGKTSFNAGLIVDIPLSKDFYIQPGLYYSKKGCKEDYEYYWDETIIKVEGKWSLSYIEMPILASYHYDIIDDVQLQINAGPFVGLSVINNIAENGGKAQVDFGMQVGAGVLLAKHYYAGVGYDWGFLKQNNMGVKATTRNFFVNIGYNF